MIASTKTSTIAPIATISDHRAEVRQRSAHATAASSKTTNSGSLSRLAPVIIKGGYTAVAPSVAIPAAMPATCQATSPASATTRVPSRASATRPACAPSPVSAYTPPRRYGNAGGRTAVGPPPGATLVGG